MTLESLDEARSALMTLESLDEARSAMMTLEAWLDVAGGLAGLDLT